MLQIPHACCKHQISTKRMFYELLETDFPFLLPNSNPLLNPLPVLIILLNPLPVLVALKVLREILSFTRSLMINIHPLVGCLENSDRKVKQFRVIPRIASSHLVYCSSIHWPNWMCLVLQRDSRFVSRNCHATHIALKERLGSNGFWIILSDKFGL